MVRLYRIERFIDEKWETLCYDMPPDKPFLFMKDEAEFFINIEKKHGTETRMILHLEDKNLHSTPFGETLRIGKKGLAISTWKCKKHKGTCRYDIKSDPACDSCIYCGEPQERY